MTISKTTLMKRLMLLCCVAAVAMGPAFAGPENDWTRFRGPGGQGKASASGLPETWDSNKNVVWKTELPGPGTSSPTILGSKIYLTSYSGYAESVDDPGDVEDLKRHLVCLDRDSGEILWSKQFDAKMPESEYRGGNSARHGYASSTIATDGDRLYAFFGISGMHAFDLEGKLLWNTDLGAGTHGWGSATSPVLYKNLVIVNASVESKSLYGLDKATGKIVWTTPGVEKCWSSPILVDVDGKQELVLNTPYKVRGFDPATGKELWFCEGIPDGYVCPTATSHDGIVYVIGGRKNTAIAVRAGGRGDVTESHRLWLASAGSNVSSPIYAGGHLYWFHESRDKVFCLNAKTGEVVFEHKLETDPGLIYASSLAADGKIYVPSQDNGTYVIAAEPEFKLLAINKFQDDPSRVNASIAVSRNQLIMRTDKAIYCIAK